MAMEKVFHTKILQNHNMPNPSSTSSSPTNSSTLSISIDSEHSTSKLPFEQQDSVEKKTTINNKFNLSESNQIPQQSFEKFIPRDKKKESIGKATNSDSHNSQETSKFQDPINNLTQNDTLFDDHSIKMSHSLSVGDYQVPNRRPIRTHTSLSRSSDTHAPLSSPIHLAFREISNDFAFPKSTPHSHSNGHFDRYSHGRNSLHRSRSSFGRNSDHSVAIRSTTYDDLSGTIVKRRDSSHFNISMADPLSTSTSVRFMENSQTSISHRADQRNQSQRRHHSQNDSNKNDFYALNLSDDSPTLTTHSIIHEEDNKNRKERLDRKLNDKQSSQTAFDASNTTSRSNLKESRSTLRNSDLQSCFQRRRSVSPLKNSRIRLETIQETLEEHYLRINDRIEVMNRDIHEMILKKEQAEMERDRIKQQMEEVSHQMKRLEEEIEHETKINTALRIVNQSGSNSQNQTLKFELQARNWESSNANDYNYIVCSYENFRDGRVTLFDVVGSESIHCRQHEKASFFIRHPILPHTFISATYSSLVQHDVFRSSDGLQIQTRRFNTESEWHFNCGAVYDDSHIITCGRVHNSPSVKFWDLNNRDCTVTFTQKNESVLDPMMKCATLPSKDIIGTSCRDGTISIWDVESGTILNTWKKNEPKGLITSIIFDPETPLLFSVVENGCSIDCWDYREPTRKPTFSLEYDDKQYRFNHLSLDSSRHRILSGGDTIHRWDLIMRRAISMFPDINSPVKQMNLLPNNSLLVLEEESLKLMECSTGTIQSQFAFDSNVVCSVNQIMIL